jgi:hypothetical protein
VRRNHLQDDRKAFAWVNGKSALRFLNRTSRDSHPVRFEIERWNGSPRVRVYNLPFDTPIVPISFSFSLFPALYFFWIRLLRNLLIVGFIVEFEDYVLRELTRRNFHDTLGQADARSAAIERDINAEFIFPGWKIG